MLSLILGFALTANSGADTPSFDLEYTHGGSSSLMLEPPSIGGPIALFVLGAGGMASSVLVVPLGMLAESPAMIGAGVSIAVAGVAMFSTAVGMFVRRVPKRRRIARVLSTFSTPGLRW